jgi:SAM-dependent methyltransferase
MSFRHKARPVVLAVRRSPLAWGLVGSGLLRGILEGLPRFQGFYDIADDFHPFDLAHGTDTSGAVMPGDLPASDLTTETTYSYVGAQPSIVRRALELVPGPEAFTFIDLGCGKGRALLIASEFPFRAIVGADIAPDLVATAQQNGRRFARRFPSRPLIQVEEGDAGRFKFPAGDFVLFLYNPFGKDIMRRVAATVEAELAAAPRRVLVVYVNPVIGECWDASPRFNRYFAATLPKAPDESIEGRRPGEAVVIWQAGTSLTAREGSSARIVSYPQENYAELQA